jgi:hypothetical protein
VRPERDDGEQAEQNWRGPKNCLVGPLALGFDAEMGADFLEGDLDLPAADEPVEDVARISVAVGCQEGLRVEFAGGIADEKPADRHWRHAAMIPQRSAGCDLDDAVGSAVPDLKNGQCFRLLVRDPIRDMAKQVPALLVGKTGNETGRAALIIFELRHGFQLILGGVKDRVIRIPLLVGSPNRSSSRGGSTRRGCRRPVRCRSCVAVDIFCG